MAERHSQKDRSERDGYAEVSPAGLQHDRGRHDARLAEDIPADDHDGSDLADVAAEVGSHSHRRDLIFASHIIERLPGRCWPRAGRRR